MYMMLMFLSVLLSSLRNIFSKGISDISFGTKEFFMSQSVTFLCAGLCLLGVSENAFDAISPVTVSYGIIYGIMLIGAQYCYTCAMRGGNMGMCSTIYSMGFILPTISGFLFWREKLKIANFLGIVLVIPIIIISGLSPETNKNQKYSDSKFIFPAVLAMISSGGLGIMQKVQQNSIWFYQKEIFLIFAFLLASFVSFVLFLTAKSSSQRISPKKYFYGVIIGVAFGFSNLLNTICAGKLKSAVFFPLLNVSTILFSVISGVVIYKEKITYRDILVFLLGALAIVMISR